MNKSRILRELLAAKETLVMPDAYDPLKDIKGPVSIAAGLGNNIQAFSINDLKECGVARVSLPTIAICATIRAVIGACEVVKRGLFAPLLQEGRLCSGQDIGRLIGA